jgi:GAF domain-containing protein/two-component sensor histidine kinase/PAS domain-containing protein
MKRISHLQGWIALQWLRIRRLTANPNGVLVWIWLIRFAVLLGITWMASIQRTNIGSDLGSLRFALLFFFFYIVVSGIGGVFFIEYLMSWPVKLAQVLIEIGLISVVILHFPAQTAAILAILYVIPIFTAMRFLQPLPATLVTMISFASMLATTGIVQVRTQGAVSIVDFLQPAATLMLPSLLLIVSSRRMIRVSDLQDEEEQLRQILERHDDGVYVVDSQKRLRFVSSFLQQRFGPLAPNTLCTKYFSCIDEACPGCEFAGNSKLNHMPDSYQTILVDRNDEPSEFVAQIQVLPGDLDDGGVVVFLREANRLQPELAVPTVFADWANLFTSLADVHRELAPTDDYDQLLSLVVDRARKWFHVESAAIFAVEEDRLVRQAVSGVTSDDFPETYARGEGVTGLALMGPGKPAYGKPIRVNDLDRHPWARQDYVNEYAQRLASGIVRHLLAVPLNGPRGSFGVLRLVNKLGQHQDGLITLRSEGFTIADEEFATAIATMVSSTLEYTKLLRDHQRQLHEISVLYGIYDASAKSIDSGAVVQEIVDHVIDAIPTARKCEVRLIDELSRTFTAHAVARRGSEDHGEPPLTIDEGVAGRALREQRIQVVRNTAKDPDFVPRSVAIHSIVVAPLLSNDIAIGTLSVDSDERDAFSEDQLRLFEALATHTALALGKVRLYERGEQLREMAAQMTESLEAETVFERLLYSFRTMVGYDNASIQLLDTARRCLQIVACDGFADPDAVRLLCFPIDDLRLPNYEVIRTKNPLVLHDVVNVYPHFAEQADRYQTHAIRAFLCLPLITRGETIGMIALGKNQPGYYRLARVNVAETIASTGASAVMNARFVSEIQQRASTLFKLLDSSPTLIVSHRPEEMYEFFTQAGTQIFDAETCSLYLWDDSHEQFQLVATTSTHPGALQVDSPARTSVAHTAIHQERQFNLSSVALYDFYRARGYAVDDQPHLIDGICRSILAGPIRNSQNTVVGAVVMENHHSNSSDDHFETLHDKLLSVFVRQLVGPLATIEARKQARESLQVDMHDMLNLVQGALVQKVGYIRARKGDISIDELESELQRIARAAKYLYQWLFRQLQDAREPIVEERGLAEALDHYARLMIGDLHFQIVKDDGFAVPTNIAYALYRIGQEALHNINKHARLDPLNGRVSIVLRHYDDHFSMQIDDNGSGFDPEVIINRSSSFGLSSIERWCQLIEAHLRINRRPEGGMRVYVEGRIRRRLYG